MSDRIRKLLAHGEDDMIEYGNPKTMRPTREDIEHPAHYADGREYEPIDVIRDWGLGFNLGNATKYISRAGRKGDAVADLRKAVFYLEHEIASLVREAATAAVPQEAETVPAATDTAPQVGTPVWREEGEERYAYIGEPVKGKHVLFAGRYGWSRWPDGVGDNLLDKGNAGSLAANLDAASASWNTEHPGLPPVIVPERFRLGEDVPKVEAPEDTTDAPAHDPLRRIDELRWTPAEQVIAAAVDVVEAAGADPRLTRAVELLGKARDAVADFVDGVGPEDTSDDGWGPWNVWTGGECPVATGVGYGVELRSGSVMDEMDGDPRVLRWAHRGDGGDIVRVRTRLPKPAEPEPETTDDWMRPCPARTEPTP